MEFAVVPINAIDHKVDLRAKLIEVFTLFLQRLLMQDLSPKQHLVLCPECLVLVNDVLHRPLDAVQARKIILLSVTFSHT